jgi:hypothetical protein
VPSGERRGVEQDAGGAAAGGRLVSHARSLGRSSTRSSRFGRHSRATV